MEFEYKYDLSENPERLKEISTDNPDDAKCFCKRCNIYFKIRPDICICRANVFLVDL